jgi:allene oxide cyclase-like protein
MNRLSLLTAALAAVAATVVLAAPGGAQSSGARTLTFLDDTAHARQAFIDNAPKSPTENPQSPRFRLSTGDMLYLHSPILDHENGTRIGTAYSQFTVVRGNSFANAVFRGHGTFRLHHGQIAADGVFVVAKATKTIAVLGGTGAYEGARGSMTFTDVEGGSQDTFHLLP